MNPTEMSRMCLCLVEYQKCQLTNCTTDLGKCCIDDRLLYNGLFRWLRARYLFRFIFHTQSPLYDILFSTLQGLFNSKPAGANGLSDCPRRKPVNLRSRSIICLSH